jgi:ornithine decarboxylase
MHIAASHELVSHLYPPSRGGAGQYRFYRCGGSRHYRSGQPQRHPSAETHGFNLPVYLLTDSDMEKPDGVTAIIAGKEQEWLELEAAACAMKRICCRRFSIP